MSHIFLCVNSDINFNMQIFLLDLCLQSLTEIANQK